MEESENKPHINRVPLNAGVEVIYSDADLTKIYNEANGLDPKRHNPITTERIFKAMRECLNIGEAMTSNV